jgi:hypothetical protein
MVRSAKVNRFLIAYLMPFSRLHFIPLSSSYREIYNIHAFFSGATHSTLAAANSSALHRQPVDGDLRLRRIARAGKQWKKTIGRTVDMEGKPVLLPLDRGLGY